MDFTKIFAGPFLDMWARILEYLPILTLAFLVFVIGLIIAPLLGGFIHKVLRFARIDTFAENSGISSALAGIGLDFSFAKVIGELTKYTVFVIFLTIMVEILGLAQITELINDLIRYIPQVVISIVLFGAGLTFGDFFKKTTMRMSLATSLSDKDGALLGMIGKFAIVTFAGMAALVQLGVAQELVQILFAGIVAGCALAMGLGSKERVAKMWEDLAEKREN